MSPSVSSASLFKLFGKLTLLGILGILGDVGRLAVAVGIDMKDAFGLFEHFNPGQTLPQRAKRISSGQYDPPSFEMSMARKDLRLMVEEAARGGQTLAMVPALAKLLDERIARGEGTWMWQRRGVCGCCATRHLVLARLRRRARATVCLCRSRRVSGPRDDRCVRRRVARLNDGGDMGDSERGAYRFGRVEVIPAAREARVDGRPVALGARAFDVLMALIEHRDRVMPKSELLDLVWPGFVVEEANLHVQVSMLRKLLGPQIIATVPGRGYRFVSTVTTAATPQAERTADAYPALPDRPSIAVLPFANLSGDPEQEYFADGMVDDVLTALSHVRWLFVIARQSSFVYKVRLADVQQISRELGVRYVVEGSVRKAGARVRIAAQLIEAESGAHLWADRYDGDLRDIFALQDEITARIVSSVEENVRNAEIRRARAKPTESLSAYDLYLRALSAWHGQTEVEYQRTQALLGQALEADPEYAEALGILTDSVCTRTIQGWHESWSCGVDEAFRLADRALATGPENSTCLASAAFAYSVLSNRFDEGFELAHRAVLVHPNSVFVCNRAAAVYSICGESDEAIALCEAACRMNPLDSKKAATSTYTVLSFALHMALRYEESIRAGRRALALAPQSNIARKYVAMSLAQLGRTEEARAEIAELLKYQPGASLAVFQLQPFRHKWMQELHMEGLRKAGLR
ncbi:MAG: winged helix-turn-helix domain-containing protein [Burkholderiaceae bacterium]|nr:winged helix-turn-helix domain-containing protein [Burkholderiaceae bacterium]